MSSDRLNLLYVQEVADIRLYKMAEAVAGAGHRVTLGYVLGRPQDTYRGIGDAPFKKVIQFSSPQELWKLSDRFDLVHCHNEPDYWTVAALAGAPPVVHDTHDMIALREAGERNLSFFEAVANRGAAGRIYTTEEQRDAAKRLYGAPEPSLVFGNYASANHLPRRFLPKLSAMDGEMHVVYQGGISGRPHREFGPLLAKIARPGVHVHILPLPRNEGLVRVFQGHPNIHFHASISPSELLEQLTQYDVGIIPFNLLPENRDFLQCTIANKFWEYLAAGLPILTSRLLSYERLFREMPVGAVFDDAETAVAQLPRLVEMARTQNLTSKARTYEEEVPRLIAFYQELLNPGA